MKLIMRSAFDNLRLNPLHGFEIDVNGDKQVVKIFRNEQLIAKKSLSKNQYVTLLLKAICDT